MGIFCRYSRSPELQGNRRATKKILYPTAAGWRLRRNLTDGRLDDFLPRLRQALVQHDGHLLLQVGEGSKGSAPEKGAPEKGTFWNAIKLIKP